jgi:hypothetical protein
MDKDVAPKETQAPERRLYEAPKLTEIGSVAQLTQDPQVVPRGTSGQPTGAQIFFLGDNA